MQSLRIGLSLGFLYACSLCYAVPVEVEQPAPQPETRIIVPPELPPNYFAMQQEKSDNDSTPLHFLRLPEGFTKNMTSSMEPSVLAIEGNKQVPIYITIPIYIYPSYHAQQAPDGTVVATTPLRQLIDAGDDKVSVNVSVDPDDVKAALKELLVDTFRDGAQVRKKRVNHHKQRRFREANGKIKAL